MTTTLFLLAEITSVRRTTSRALAEIVLTCARDVGVPVQAKARGMRKHGSGPTIVLHLPAEFAAEQHPAWCLACRLACFCAEARVSVLIHSDIAFDRIARRQFGLRSA